MQHDLQSRWNIYNDLCVYSRIRNRNGTRGASMKVLAGALVGAAMAMFSYMMGATIDTAFLCWAIILTGGIAASGEF